VSDAFRAAGAASEGFVKFVAADRNVGAALVKLSGAKPDWTPAGEARRAQPSSRSNASSRRSAFPRWLTACFSWGASSAAVRPKSGSRK
jgi:hypothetical protein